MVRVAAAVAAAEVDERTPVFGEDTPRKAGTTAKDSDNTHMTREVVANKKRALDAIAVELWL